MSDHEYFDAPLTVFLIGKATKPNDVAIEEISVSEYLLKEN